jgi:hypothetical protein
MAEFQILFRMKKTESLSTRSLLYSKPAHFLLLVLFNLQTFGQGIDFCFDGSKEGK